MPKETSTKTFAACCNDCDTNGCCHNNFHGGSPQYVVLRWLLGLLILAVTFAIGLKLGEFKAGMWGQNYFGGGMGNMHYQMMQDWKNAPFPPVMMQANPALGVPEAGTSTSDGTAKTVPQKKTTPQTTK